MVCIAKFNQCIKVTNCPCPGQPNVSSNDGILITSTRIFFSLFYHCEIGCFSQGIMQRPG